MGGESKQLKVLFSRKKVAPLPRQVVIMPADNSWNDFGYQIRCFFTVHVGRNREPVEGDMFIGFLPPPEATNVEQKEFNERLLSLDNILEELGRETAGPEDVAPFFTLLPDMKNYRHVVDCLGVRRAEIFLRSVNDLVVYKQLTNDWIQKALASKVFNRGFMRNSEPFFAFHNAEYVLGEVEEENFSAISTALDLKFSLEGFQNSHEINFRFSNDGLIPRRINVLIGKNGLGKSQALRHFCRAALRYKDPHSSLVDSNDDNGRPMISRVLAVATPGETRNTFPPERKKSQKLFYRRLNLTRNGRARVSHSIGETLVQLARSEERIGGSSRWDLFLGALEKSLPDDELLIALKSSDYVTIQDLSRSGAEQANLDLWADIDSNVEPRIQVSGSDNAYPLSSGQLTFFKFALLCCLYIENSSFVLMDEPETHMHPNMISDFIELLDYLLEKTGSYAILATHSVYFVREVPKEQVQVFRQQEHRIIDIDNPRLRTFGATVDAISQFVFEEDVESRLTDKIFEKVKKRSFESVDKELNNELSLAALMDLRRRLEAV